MDISNSNDLIKIKEDAIRIQEKDLEDTVRSIADETHKSSLIIGFIGAVFILSFGYLDDIPLPYIAAFILLLLLAACFALWNMAPKKTIIHTNVDEVFVKGKPDKREEYLGYRHLSLRASYGNAKTLLYRKASCTKWALIFLILSSFFLVLIKILIKEGVILYGK